MSPSREAAIRETDHDLERLRTLTRSLVECGSDRDDRLLQAAVELLRQRAHRLFLLEWPSGAP
jgi:hypothetical protein